MAFPGPEQVTRSPARWERDNSSREVSSDEGLLAPTKVNVEVCARQTEQHEQRYCRRLTSSNGSKVVLDARMPIRIDPIANA